MMAGMTTNLIFFGLVMGHPTLLRRVLTADLSRFARTGLVL